MPAGFANGVEGGARVVSADAGVKIALQLQIQGGGSGGVHNGAQCVSITSSAVAKAVGTPPRVVLRAHQDTRKQKRLASMRHPSRCGIVHEKIAALESELAAAGSQRFRSFFEAFRYAATYFKVQCAAVDACVVLLAFRCTKSRLAGLLFLPRSGNQGPCGVLLDTISSQ